MTDELLIRNFLNRNFKNIFSTGSFIFKDTFKETILNQKQAVDLLFKIFHLDLFKISDYLDSWRSEMTFNYTKKLFQYLDNCRIVEGRSNWIVLDADNIKVTQEKMLNKFKDEYSKFDIVHFYDKWYEDKIIELTEKILGEY